MDYEKNEGLPSSLRTFFVPIFLSSFFFFLSVSRLHLCASDSLEHRDVISNNLPKTKQHHSLDLSKSGCLRFQEKWRIIIVYETEKSCYCSLPL